MAVFSVARLQLQRRGAEPGPDVRRASSPSRSGSGAAHSLAAVLDRIRGPLLGGIPGALVIPGRAAGDPGPVGVRRVPVRGARPVGRRHHEPGGRDRSVDREGQRVGTRDGPLQRLHGQRPAAGRGYRPRSHAQPRPADSRGHRRAAGAPRVAVRERLRLQQPRLPRLRAGRPAVPRAAGRPAAVLRARVERPDGAARRRRAPARDDGAGGHQPLQPVPLGRDHRRRRVPGVSSGQALQAMEQVAAQRAAAGLRLRVGGAVARGDQGGLAGGVHLRARDRARLPRAGGAVRKLGAAVHHPARRAAGRASARSARSGCAGCRTTCSARSGSSCSSGWRRRTRS